MHSLPRTAANVNGYWNPPDPSDKATDDPDAERVVYDGDELPY